MLFWIILMTTEGLSLQMLQGSILLSTYLLSSHTLVHRFNPQWLHLKPLRSVETAKLSKLTWTATSGYWMEILLSSSTDGKINFIVLFWYFLNYQLVCWVTFCSLPTGGWHATTFRSIEIVLSVLFFIVRELSLALNKFVLWLNKTDTQPERTLRWATHRVRADTHLL